MGQPSKIGRATVSTETLQENATALEGVLGDFGVRGEIINARPGPVVTLYELEPAPGIKSSRVISLADDIARSMSALSARVAVVSGRNAIGIELPNPTREKVYLRELLASRDYADTNHRLPLCLGKSIGGEPIRRSLNTTNWTAASSVVHQWQAAGQIGVLKPEIPTVAEAVGKFLAEAAVRNLAATTIQKRREFERGTVCTCRRWSDR